MKPWSIIYSVASVLYWVFLDYIQHKLLHIRKLMVFSFKNYINKKNPLKSSNYKMNTTNSFMIFHKSKKS